MSLTSTPDTTTTPDIYDLPEALDTPDGNPTTRLDRTIVQQLTRALDRSERLLLMLHYADGLTAAEIGIILNQPVLKITEKLAVLRDRIAAMLGMQTVAVA